MINLYYVILKLINYHVGFQMTVSKEKNVKINEYVHLYISLL